MEEQVNALKLQLESQSLQLSAIKEALLNIVGFYIDQEDGSQQGLIKFGAAPAQVPAQPVVAEEVV